MPSTIMSCRKRHSCFIASHSAFARSRSPASIASMARSIVGRDISESSSSENHRSAICGPLSCPVADIASRAMQPLITREEALALGSLTDHAEIAALARAILADHAAAQPPAQPAWRGPVERLGDSTDLCSLVNAKSGGCAEDCGFCSQSRFAEAPTPMHAMMSPEQILEHARAAEAAGAHRFCMVTQGQGLSKRDFQNVLDGARLVAE